MSEGVIDLEIELKEWLESLDYVVENRSPEYIRHLLEQLELRARQSGVEINFSANTPYINTITRSEQPTFPGSREIERRIKSIVRWNAMAMVVRANRDKAAPGGHISTFASSATL